MWKKGVRILTEQKTHIATILANLRHTSSGYDLLRYVGLPDMLGKDAGIILYVLGKNLARKAECESFEELFEFFLHSGWGELQLVHEKRKKYIFELSGDIIQSRLATFENIDFQIELGFIAETITRITDTSCECTSEIKKGQVLLHAILHVD